MLDRCIDRFRFGIIKYFKRSAGPLPAFERKLKMCSVFILTWTSFKVTYPSFSIYLTDTGMRVCVSIVN